MKTTGTRRKARQTDSEIVRHPCGTPRVDTKMKRVSVPTSAGNVSLTTAEDVTLTDTLLSIRQQSTALCIPSEIKQSMREAEIYDGEKVTLTRGVLS